MYQVTHYTTSGLGTVLSGSLSVSAFFLHFLDWWYSSEQHSTAAAVTALPTPPPPKNAVSEGGKVPKGSQELCPLCRRVRTNHTALAVSG